jgi:superfamily II DNA or RNA helicase
VPDVQLPAGASWVTEVADHLLLRTVGQTTFDRGRSYARQGRVGTLGSGDHGRMLLGSVLGSGRHVYQTLVTAGSDPLSWTSRCSCPVVSRCKHGVAVVLAARAQLTGEVVDAEPAPPDWEVRLAPLLRTAAPVVDRGGAAMALVVDVVERSTGFVPGRPPSLVHAVRLRPTRRTRAGTWARGASWTDVIGERYGRGPADVDERHRAALAELYRLHETAADRYTYRPDVVLDDMGPQAWPVLRRAVEAGVELLQPAGHVGTVTLVDHPVQPRLDVRREADGGVLLEAEAVGLEPRPGAGELVLVGRPAHGLAVVRGAQTVLAELTGPVEDAFADLLRDSRPVRVPADDAERFTSLFLPRLRDRAPVASADGSVEVGAGPAPQVDVVVQTDGGVVGLALAFRYGGLRVRADATDAARDHAAERALLDRATVLHDVPGAVTGPGPRGGRRLAATAHLVGLAAVRFVTEQLPLLAADPDVHVEVAGELPVFEESTAAPLIEVATSDDGERTDWFDLHVTVTVDGEDVPFEPLFAALSRDDDALLLDSGTWFRLDHPGLDDLRRLIEEARSLTEGTPGGLRINRFQVGLWDELVSLGVVGEQARRWKESVDAVRGLADAPRPPLPHGLTAVLRPYQHDGYHWLSTLWDARLGGVLADDMGLGKTLQVLALLVRAQERGELDAPVLVVAPTSVTGTWAAEAARFAPSLRVQVVGETSRRRGTPLAQAVEGADVVVTSYAVLRIDDRSFREHRWRGLVLDEAQFVKNHQSKTYHAARRLEVPFTLAVTGTPLENSLMDLWSMFSLAAPGLYPRPDRFTQEIRRPIESGTRPDLLDTLRRRIRPLMLRRTKEQVASDLPPKQVQLLQVPLHPVHRRLYDQHLQRERQRVLGLLDDPVGNRVAILASLTRLRQLALHPGLVGDEHPAVASAKLETLAELARELADEGHRALVFSQFTRFLRMARTRLEEEGLTTRYLDGRTRDRQREIDAFRAGDGDVFCISLKAGGFGLTLTEADYVFVLDPWWNPATEAQAIDRVHRIGQEHPVHVYRLVSQGTIEEKVVALQERKRDLFDRVVDDGGALTGAVTADDLRGLLEG